MHDIALFLNHAYLRKNYSVAFSDCDPKTKCNLGLGHMIHSIYPDVNLLPWECYATDTENLDSALLWWSKISLCFLYFRPEYNERSSKQLSAAESDFYAPGASWYIHKGNAYSLAAKAGHNDEPHNHNDVGSFHLVTDNGQQLVDLGPSLYTINAFVDEYRYQVFGNSSLGHNLPIIDGMAQMYGKEFCGTMTAIDQGVELEIAKAYPHEILSSLKRTLVCGENSVELKDAFSFDGGEHTITERFVTYDKPEITPEGVKFGEVELIFDAEKWKIEINVHEHTSNANFAGKTTKVYTLDLSYRSGAEAEFAMRIKINV